MENWKCPDCETRFWPESTDMHRIRLRDQFAGMAIPEMVRLACEGSINIKDHPEALLREVVAHNAYCVADTMLIERDKKS